MRTPLVRRVYNTVLGVALSFFCYGVSGFGYIPYNMICYVCMHCTPRRYCAYITTALTGTILTVTHIHRYLHTDGTDYSIDTLLMMTFVK